MPNVTISVSENLKSDMDRLPEVNWSEICRKAISIYITQRDNPTPRIELEIRSSTVTAKSFDTGYPTLSITLKVHNKMDSRVVVDRILSTATFWEYQTAFPIGSAYNLRRRPILPHSSTMFRIDFPLLKEKISELSEKFTKTFDCRVANTVYVESFGNEYNQEVKTQIPIDIWKDIVKKSSNESLNEKDQ